MSQEQEKVADLGPDVFPVDMHWVPRDLSTGPAAQKKGGTMGGEIFVVAAADGKSLRAAAAGGGFIVISGQFSR